MNKETGLVGLVMLSAMVGCGGGGGGAGDANGGASQPSLFTVPASAVNVQSATTNHTFATPPLAGEFIAFGATCPTQAGSHAVKQTANALVYNADTVSDAVLTEIAQYAEASIQTLRTRYGINQTTGFDGDKVRVCASANNGSNGSAGYNTLFVGTRNTGHMLAQLVHHEMVHVVQTQALNCRTYQFAFERWLTEGMALHVAQQDQPANAALPALRTTFSTVATQTPYGDIDGRSFPVTARYPGYRLAFDTFLGESLKTDVDVYNFLKSYGGANGCPGTAMGGLPAGSTGWKTSFDATFTNATFTANLRGAGLLGNADTFWSTASKYTR